MESCRPGGPFFVFFVGGYWDTSQLRRPGHHTNSSDRRSGRSEWHHLWVLVPKPPKLLASRIKLKLTKAARWEHKKQSACYVSPITFLSDIENTALIPPLSVEENVSIIVACVPTIRSILKTLGQKFNPQKTIRAKAGRELLLQIPRKGVSSPSRLSFCSKDSEAGKSDGQDQNAYGSQANLVRLSHHESDEGADIPFPSVPRPTVVRSHKNETSIKKVSYNESHV